MSTEMTAFFEDFQFHSCVPPKEEVAIIMKREFFLKSVVSFAERHPTHESESRAMISALRLLGDGCTICSKTDVMHFFGERDGARLFDQMRRGA